MKKCHFSPLFLLAAALFYCVPETTGQEPQEPATSQGLPVQKPNPEDPETELLDLKLELLNSQIELFNSRLKVWETKPAELEQRLAEVDARIESLNFDPVYLNSRMEEIEKLVEETRESGNRMAPDRKEAWRPFRPDSIPETPYGTAIAINPVRLGEGTFHLSYERVLSPKIGLGIAGLATYATEEGISSLYIRNQSLDYYNPTLESYLPYHDKNISGYGLEVTMRNYLLTDLYKKQKAPVGLYAAPSFLFRRLWLKGISEYYLDDEWVTEEVTRLLNVYTLGAGIGWKFTLLRVLYVDLYAGGMIRLARYDNEEGFTRYKALGNIDYSGVLPTASVSIGILK